MKPGPDGEIGRRDFGRLTLGTLGIAALAGPAGQAAQKELEATPGIKLCAQSPAKPIGRGTAVPQADRRASMSASAPRPTCGPPKAFCRSRSATRMPASRCGTSATPACTTCRRSRSTCRAATRRSRSTSNTSATWARRASTTPPTPTWATASGAAAAATIRGASAREFDHGSPNKAGVWDGKSLHEPLSHGRVFTQGRNLGELHLLHQAGGAGGGRGRRPHRHPSGRSAGAGAGRRAALHLRQLRRLQAGDGDRQQPERRHLPLLRHAGSKAARR